MKAKTFDQACYRWACHVEDNMGSKLNEHSHPDRESSQQNDTAWILRNHFGVLAIIDKQKGVIL